MFSFLHLSAIQDVRIAHSFIFFHSFDTLWSQPSHPPSTFHLCFPNDKILFLLFFRVETKLRGVKGKSRVVRFLCFWVPFFFFFVLFLTCNWPLFFPRRYLLTYHRFFSTVRTRCSGEQRSSTLRLRWVVVQSIVWAIHANRAFRCLAALCLLI